MRKTMLGLLMTLLCLAPFAAHAEAEEPDLPEWTVMFYMCGSDLESRYEYASKNMTEITRCHDSCCCGKFSQSW